MTKKEGKREEMGGKAEMGRERLRERENGEGGKDGEGKSLGGAEGGETGSKVCRVFPN